MIIAALQKTRLWLNFSPGNSEPPVMKARQSLNKSITSSPQMSTGQSQLFAPARAMIQTQGTNHQSSLSESQFNAQRIMPILLLDEVTSSLNPETQSVTRKIMSQEFTEKGHTVISITHRLSGVTEGLRAGQDMIAWLSQGMTERIGGVEDILDIEG